MVRAGGFTREMGVDLCAPFPAGFELLEAWWVVFLRHDVLIELAGVEMLLLCAAGAYALAREVNLTERPAAWAAFLTVLTPGLYLSATACLNDIAIAALVIVTMAFVLTRAPGAGSRSRSGSAWGSSRPTAMRCRASCCSICS